MSSSKNHLTCGTTVLCNRDGSLWGFFLQISNLSCTHTAPEMRDQPLFAAYCSVFFFLFSFLRYNGAVFLSCLHV